MVHARRRARVEDSHRPDAGGDQGVDVSDRRAGKRASSPSSIAGQTINPATDDFYQRLIIHRNAIKAKLETASTPDKARAEERRASHQDSRQRDQLRDFRRVECGRVRQDRADGRLWREAAPVPLQIPNIREARRILSPAARNADHRGGAIDVGAGRASGHRTGVGLGLLRHRQHRHRQHPRSSAGGVYWRPRCGSASGSRTSIPTAKIA